MGDEMGLPRESIKHLYEKVQHRLVKWDEPRIVRVWRGASGKLGFHFKTLQQCASNSDETVTVVVLVKQDCITEGTLYLLDRIVSVDDVPVTRCSEDAIRMLLSQSCAGQVSLLVTAMSRPDQHTQVKRYLSVNSGTSRNSGTASVSSGEKPLVKRFAKSNSTETEASAEVGESTPLLSPAGHLPNSEGHRSGHIVKGIPSGMQNQRLPKKMESEIILHDIVCELGDSDSPPNTQNFSSPRTTSSPYSASPSVIVPESSPAYIERAVRSDRSAAANGNPFGVEICSLPDCDTQTCLWHKFVLSFPQYVIWDPFTKTVELRKNGGTSFGFKFKVKKHDGPPGEVFALVTDIVSGGAAWKQLLPGDWIRSVNGTAVNSAEEAFRLDFRSFSSLRLVIQRPAKLLHHGAGRLKQLAMSMEKPSNLPLSSSYGMMTQHISITSAASSECFISPVCNSSLEQPAAEHIPLNTMSPRLCKNVMSAEQCMLMRTRVIVCGSRAGDLVRGLLADFDSVVDINASVQCFQLFMQSTTDSGIQIHTWPELNTAGSGLGSLNLELYIISDESFFHQCSSLLFNTSTVLLFTFDVSKLLNQPEPEMKRLTALVHTADACSMSGGHSTSMHLYGLLSARQPNVLTEEVQALFYVTPAGSQLLQTYELSPPDIVSPCCASDMDSIRCSLFQWCRSLSEQCMVVAAPVAGVLDALMSSSALSVSTEDLKDLLGQTLPDVHHRMLVDLTRDLVATGNLIPYGKCQDGAESKEEYLLPFNLLLVLGQFLTKTNLDSLIPSSRQKWFRLLSSARISAPDLRDILEGDSLPGCQLTPQVLTHIGIIFPFRPASKVTPRDSGFGEDAVEYVVPYFLVDQQVPQLEASCHFLVIFQASLPWRVYFDILATLSMHSSTETLDLPALHACLVTTRNLRLCLQLQKNTSRLFISACRVDKSQGSVLLQDIKELLDLVVPRNIYFTLQAADTQGSRSDTTLVSAVQKLPFEEQTTCKQLLSETDPTDTSVKPQPEKKFDVPLRSLSWSTLKNVAIRLNMDMTTGNNWREVAEHAGRSVDEICAYEGLMSSELPAMLFLKEWSVSATVQQLLNILEAIGRPDVRDIIIESFNNKKS